MEVTMRLVWLIFAAALFALTPDSRAEVASPHSGTKVIETGKPFAVFVDDLQAAIKANNMGVVAQACASCGAKSIGVTIPGNRVVMIFRPDFAVRMLAASEAAGIEAPLRLYVTERPDGRARLTYRLPSHTFGIFRVEALDALAAELDAIVARIVTDAVR
jgi:uncharacterized protein (DUF302 family)